MDNWTPQEKIQWLANFLDKTKNQNDALSVQKRSLAVLQMELIMDTKFKNTKDYKEKLKNYLITSPIEGKDLKEARRKDNLTQQALAKQLGVSRALIGHMERNERPLSKKVKQYIKDAFKRHRKIKSFYGFGVKMPLGIAPKGSNWK